ncbi:carboxypeptidase regulatory-like domain-containing protein [Paraburkholderia phymatum]|uniref:Carboxypeptidase regulatory-like domain-containing protein n=1 Tax=Paraburkholderia phymatum TaxID=148447 RepID=A0ACC6UBL9_9BURK
MKRSYLLGKQTLWMATTVVALSVLTACGGSGSPPTGTINGTAAIGVPFASATISIVCKNRSASTTTDSSGKFNATFAFDGPCTLTGTGGSTTLHSFAAGPGTYNLTSLTELLLSYLAAQLGTTVNGLLAGLPTNPKYQSALTSGTVITNAESAVAQVVKDMYGVTLSTSAFLTTAFTTGQPGIDADLDKLHGAGAIDSTGQPVSELVNALVNAGAKNPITGSGNGSTGGTGGTGGTGAT